MKNVFFAVIFLAGCYDEFQIDGYLQPSDVGDIDTGGVVQPDNLGLAGVAIEEQETGTFADGVDDFCDAWIECELPTYNPVTPPNKPACVDFVTPEQYPWADWECLFDADSQYLDGDITCTGWMDSWKDCMDKNRDEKKLFCSTWAQCDPDAPALNPDCYKTGLEDWSEEVWSCVAQADTRAFKKQIVCSDWAEQWRDCLE